MKRILCTVVVALAASFASARTSKLSLAEWTSYNFREPRGIGTYAFGYEVDDAARNNVQFRNEERHPNGTVTGSYGYVDPDGKVRVVNYVADQNGYRATEESSLHISMLKPLVDPASSSIISSKTHQQPQTILPWYRQGHPGH